MDQKIDLLVSFDTTGSMYPVLSQVRLEVEKFVKQMFNEFTDLRIGIIAHGDYCDANDPYTIIIQDFSRDQVGLCRFVKNTQKTYGGDADECYELVLNTARTKLSWRDDADKVLLMIGDASPHSVHYSGNRDRIDWEEEARLLGTMGVRVFAVHALSKFRQSSKGFYKTVANVTDGTYLTLDQFNEVINLIKATCYQRGGIEKLNEFITIIRDNGEMTNSMNNNFRRLMGEIIEEETYTYSKPSYTGRRKSSSRVSGEGSETTLKEMDRLVPVTPGRFQIMTVTENCDIKGFVTKNGIEFKKGRGFYELSKAETVQQYKEVIMMDKATGEMFNGSQVREELGLQPQSVKGGVNERLHKDAAKKFRVFVQSTSVNRKLIAGTTFLYEVADLEDTGTVVEETAAKTTSEVTKPAEVKKKTTKKVSKKKEVAKDTSDATFDIDLEKVLSGESKEDTKILAAIKAKKSSKKSKSLKEVAKDTGMDGFSLADIEKATSDCIDTLKADEDTKVTKKPATKKKVVNTLKIEHLLEKVNTGIERYNTSNNKRNTEFLKNNLERLAKEAERLAEILNN